MEFIDATGFPKMHHYVEFSQIESHVIKLSAHNNRIINVTYMYVIYLRHALEHCLTQCLRDSIWGHQCISLNPEELVLEKVAS